jgi:hypothetical protein
MEDTMLNSPQARSRRSLHWTLAAALFSTGGCTVGAERSQQVEQLVETSQSLLATPIDDWADPSNNINITLFRCDWMGPATVVSGSCILPADYVAVGGGAEIDNEGDPGALLIFSFPLSDLTGWFVGSRDHIIVPYEHYLRGYVLGMRVRVSGDTYMSAAQLRNHMYVVSKSTEVSEGAVAAVANISQSPFYQSGDLMVGGGAATFSPGDSEGQILWGSHPSIGGNAMQWVAYSKDHGADSPTTVTAYAIGMRQCLEGTGKCFAQFTASSGTTVAGIYQDGYATMQRGSEIPYPMTSIGAFSSGWSAGRLLTDLIPNNGGELGNYGWPEVRSKEHHFFDNSGSFYAYGVYMLCISDCQN